QHGENRATTQSRGHCWLATFRIIGQQNSACRDDVFAQPVVVTSKYAYIEGTITLITFRSHIMIKVISITEEVLLRGGGKVKAIYNRLNGFSEMDGFSAILMTTAHSVEQKLDIEALRKEGTLAPEDKHFTLPELCAPVAITEGLKLFYV